MVRTSGRGVRPSLLVLLSSLLLPLVGCEAVGPETYALVRDSSGVSIVLNDLSAPAAWPICAVDAAPALRIGSRTGPPDEVVLFDVEDVSLLSDGGVAAVLRDAAEVRVFDADGSFRIALGSRGEGPGEFLSPVEIETLPGDSLAVYDWELSRVSVFTAEGEAVRDIRFDPPILSPTGHFAVVEPESRVIVTSHFVRIPTGTEFEAQDLHLVLFDGGGSQLDTVMTLPYGSVGWVDREARMYGRPVFESRGTFAARGDWLALANGASPEIEIRGLDGSKLRVIRWTPPDLAVTETEVGLQRVNELDGVSGGMRRLILRRHEIVPVSERFPNLRSLRLDAEGSVWTQQYLRPSHTEQVWWRFGSEGVFECAASFPRDLRVFEFSADRVVGTREDELGVEYIEIYSIGPVASDSDFDP